MAARQSGGRELQKLWGAQSEGEGSLIAREVGSIARAAIKRRLAVAWNCIAVSGEMEERR